MERLTGSRARGFRSTSIAVVAYGIAMGYVEAAVVVYLRGALGPSATVLGPGPEPAAWAAFDRIEVVRELATLVMIAAVGWLAGRSAFERLAWAAVAFGCWDIVYYAGLWIAIGWPSSLTTWDVLLLAPMPWVGPVWAPMVVSVALVAVGLVAAARLRAGRTVAVGPWRALGGLGGGVLVVLSFLIDSNRVIAGDLSAWTGWVLFSAGMLLALAASVSALRT